MSWLKNIVGFAYDFLADDGWELLVGLLIILPVTHLIISNLGLDWLGLLVLLVGVLTTIGVSLARKLPRRSTS